MQNADVFAEDPDFMLAWNVLNGAGLNVVNDRGTSRSADMKGPVCVRRVLMQRI